MWKLWIVRLNDALNVPRWCRCQSLVGYLNDSANECVGDGRKICDLSEAETRNVFGTLEKSSKLAISILRIRIDSQSSITNLWNTSLNNNLKSIDEGSYQILALQGLSMYSSGEEERTDPTFCASILWARTFAPHDALAKFLRSLPFFAAFVEEDICGTFVVDVVPFATFKEAASGETLFRLAISPFSRSMKNKNGDFTWRRLNELRRSACNCCCFHSSKELILDKFFFVAVVAVVAAVVVIVVVEVAAVDCSSGVGMSATGKLKMKTKRRSSTWNQSTHERTSSTSSDGSPVGDGISFSTITGISVAGTSTF